MSLCRGQFIQDHEQRRHLHLHMLHGGTSFRKAALTAACMDLPSISGSCTHCLACRLYCCLYCTPCTADFVEDKFGGEGEGEAGERRSLMKVADCPQP